MDEEIQVDFLFLLLIEEFYYPSYTVTITSESQFQTVVMSLPAGIPRTRKHCSRMPTTRLYVFHNEQVWTCPRGSLYSDVNAEQVWICLRGFAAHWISRVMVTSPPPPWTDRHKRKTAGGKKLTSPSLSKRLPGLVIRLPHCKEKKKKKPVLISRLRWHCADLCSVPEFALVLRRAVFPFIAIFH